MGFFSGGTSDGEQSRERLKNLPQHYSQYDLEIGWEIKAAGSDTLVAGVAKNVRYAFMEGLELRVALLDAAGKPGVSSVCFIIPRQLRQDQMAPFEIRLPVHAGPGSRLRFTYRYQSTEDGAGNWQSFDAEVPKTEA
jgi:hypothetical protein